MGHLSHWVISTWSQRFKLHVQWYLIDFLWDDWYRDNFKEMFKFEMYLTRRSKYRLCIALSNFQLDRNWFKFHLQWYLIDSLWDDWYRDNFKEMFKFEMYLTRRSKYRLCIALSNFQLDRNWFKFHLEWYLIDSLWDDWYRDNFKEMFKFEMYFNKAE